MTSKRIFDLVLSIPSLIVLAPLMLLVSILIKVDSSGPVFFKQTRVGKLGKLFKIYKFRTMNANSDKNTIRVTTSDDIRITTVGYWLRRCKIDELPQLLNVILGQMSLVGPRPEVPEYIKLYSENVRNLILSVQPGITDYAAIEFRNESDLLNSSNDPHRVYIEKVMPIKQQHYLRYIKEKSLKADLIIIIRTLREIIFN